MQMFFSLRNKIFKTLYMTSIFSRFAFKAIGLHHFGVSCGVKLETTPPHQSFLPSTFGRNMRSLANQMDKLTEVQRHGWMGIHQTVCLIQPAHSATGSSHQGANPSSSYLLPSDCTTAVENTDCDTTQTVTTLYLSMITIFVDIFCYILPTLHHTIFDCLFYPIWCIFLFFMLCLLYTMFHFLKLYVILLYYMLTVYCAMVLNTF